MDPAPHLNITDKKNDLPQYSDLMTHDAALRSFHAVMQTHKDSANQKEQKIPTEGIVKEFHDWFNKYLFTSVPESGQHYRDHIKIVLTSTSDSFNEINIEMKPTNKGALILFSMKVNENGLIIEKTEPYAASYPDMAFMLTKIANLPPAIPITKMSCGPLPYDHLVAQDLLAIVQGKMPTYYTSKEHIQLFAEVLTLLAFESEPMRDNSLKQFGTNILLLDMIAKKQTYGKNNKRYLFCNCFDSAKYIDGELMYKRTEDVEKNERSTKKEPDYQPVLKYKLISEDQRLDLIDHGSLIADIPGGKSPGSTKSPNGVSKGMFSFNNDIKFEKYNWQAYLDDNYICQNRVLMKQAKILYYWLKNNNVNITPDEKQTLEITKLEKDKAVLNEKCNDLLSKIKQVEKNKALDIANKISNLPIIKLNNSKIAEIDIKIGKCRKEIKDCQGKEDYENIQMFQQSLITGFIQEKLELARQKKLFSENFKSQYDQSFNQFEVQRGLFVKELDITYKQISKCCINQSLVFKDLNDYFNNYFESLASKSMAYHNVNEYKYDDTESYINTIRDYLIHMHNEKDMIEKLSDPVDKKLHEHNLKGIYLVLEKAILEERLYFYMQKFNAIKEIDALDTMSAGEYSNYNNKIYELNMKRNDLDLKFQNHYRTAIFIEQNDTLMAEESENFQWEHTEEVGLNKKFGEKHFPNQQIQDEHGLETGTKRKSDVVTSKSVQTTNKKLKRSDDHLEFHTFGGVSKRDEEDDDNAGVGFQKHTQHFYTNPQSSSSFSSGDPKWNRSCFGGQHSQSSLTTTNHTIDESDSTMHLFHPDHQVTHLNMQQANHTGYQNNSSSKAFCIKHPHEISSLHHSSAVNNGIHPQLTSIPSYNMQPSNQQKNSQQNISQDDVKNKSSQSNLPVNNTNGSGFSYRGPGR